jgi:hypothetical protein
VRSLRKSIDCCTSLGASSCDVGVGDPKYLKVVEAIVRGSRFLGYNYRKKDELLRS